MTALVEYAAQIYYPDGLIFAGLAATFFLLPVTWKKASK